MKSIFILVVVLSLYICCDKSNGYNVDYETMKSVKFTLDFYRAIFNKNENTIVSPISFRSILSSLYLSVINDSERELREKVYFDEKIDAYNMQRQLYLTYNTTENIKFCNKLYLSDKGTLKPSYLEILNGLGCQIEQVDFTSKYLTAQKMNIWVENQTNGFIKELISPEALTIDTALILINTLYINVEWQNQFAADAEMIMNFTDINGLNHETKYMFDDKHSYKVAILNNINAEVLELPYADETNLVFWVILPNENSNIFELHNSLSHDMIKETVRRFHEDFYDIVIPRFEMESAIDGVATLRKLGLNAIFDSNDTFMLEGNGITVSDIRQKCKIIVNADETEVAEVTDLDGLFRIGTPTFYVTRPFIYMILNANTYEPLFVGHYSKPQPISSA